MAYEPIKWVDKNSEDFVEGESPAIDVGNLAYMENGIAEAYSYAKNLFQNLLDSINNSCAMVKRDEDGAVVYSKSDCDILSDTTIFSYTWASSDLPSSRDTFTGEKLISFTVNRPDNYTNLFPSKLTVDFKTTLGSNVDRKPETTFTYKIMDSDGNILATSRDTSSLLNSDETYMLSVSWELTNVSSVSSEKSVSVACSLTALGEEYATSEILEI